MQKSTPLQKTESSQPVPFGTVTWAHPPKQLPKMQLRQVSVVQGSLSVQVQSAAAGGASATRTASAAPSKKNDLKARFGIRMLDPPSVERSKTARETGQNFSAVIH